MLHITQASLLPKLRDHFAEFLNEGSLARLRILSSPTCVGLRYGLLVLISGFSWQCGISQFRYYSSLLITSQAFVRRTSLPDTLLA